MVGRTDILTVFVAIHELGIDWMVISARKSGIGTNGIFRGG